LCRAREYTRGARGRAERGRASARVRVRVHERRATAGRAITITPPGRRVCTRPRKRARSTRVSIAVAWISRRRSHASERASGRAGARKIARIVFGWGEEAILECKNEERERERERASSDDMFPFVTPIIGNAREVTRSVQRSETVGCGYFRYCPYRGDGAADDREEPGTLNYSRRRRVGVGHSRGTHLPDDLRSYSRELSGSHRKTRLSILGEGGGSERESF